MKLKQLGLTVVLYSILILNIYYILNLGTLTSRFFEIIGWDIEMTLFIKTLFSIFSVLVSSFVAGTIYEKYNEDSPEIIKHVNSSSF